MNKLNLLIERWKAGSIKDPDLSLALKALHDVKIERLKNERISTDKSGIDPVSGENNSTSPKRPKTKGL
jgi:hypothetical protein